MRAVASLVVTGLVALLLALCLATSAHAHAVLIAAEPADGSVVTEAPKTVVLRFNEAVAPTAVSLLDAAGKPRDVTIRADGRVIHPMYLFEVKKPDEAKYPYDYYRLISTIPAEQAFRPIAEGGCELVK